MRSRRTTQRLVSSAQDITNIDDKIYIGNYEVKRKYQGSSAEPIEGEKYFERTTLRVMDGDTCVAIIYDWLQDDRSQEVDSVPTVKLQYQLGNHLGSISLELSQAAELISYEEYFAYGGSSFMAGSNQKEVNSKEYRYSGKERDDTTGLYYYGARYYAPWIGRWITTDPAHRVDGMGLYQFVSGNPITYEDPTGEMGKPATKAPKKHAAKGGSKGAGAPTALPPPPKGLPQYALKKDTTTPNAVRTRGWFGTPSDHREKASMTKQGHTSGLHETLPTNLDKAFKHAQSSGTIPAMAGEPAGKVNKVSAKRLTRAANNTRSDTARTVMAAPSGQVAGHTHSGVPTTGQSHAHDLERRVFIRAARQVPTTKGFTDRSAALLSAAVAVASMAPGALARQHHDTSKLRDKAALPTYEVDRNDAKVRLERVAEDCTPDERAWAGAHVDSLYDNFGDITRSRATGRMTSPLRAEGGTGHEVTGGNYDATATHALAVVSRQSEAPPSATDDIGAYITAPFRAPR